MTALYSLVRYVEDVDRAEPVNVGALVWVDGQVLKKFVDRREGIDDFDVVRRFDELLGYLLERSDRGATDARGDEEPLLFTLARRRFSHFEITEPRQIEARQEPEALLTRLVDELVDEPASRRFAGFRFH